MHLKDVMHVKSPLLFPDGFLKLLTIQHLMWILLIPLLVKQNTSNKGLGINLPVNVLDLKTCFLRINPNSRGGKLLYGPDSDYDMNRFLWDVIQDDGATNGGLRWRDPVTQRTIAWFTYYGDSPFAFTAADSSSSGYQNTEISPNGYKYENR